MLLLLDNYDSFTWNLHHYIASLVDETIVVKQNDELAVADCDAFTSIVLSPGPGLPADAGIVPQLIKRLAHRTPILGICLGHQAIGEAFGCRLENLDQVWHGVQKEVIVRDSNDRLFTGLPASIQTGHYHSWVLSRKAFPDDLAITAEDDAGTIMAISHKKYPVSGVQFHPESVMTGMGMEILKNWLRFCKNFHESGVGSSPGSNFLFR